MKIEIKDIEKAIAKLSVVEAGEDYPMVIERLKEGESLSICRHNGEICWGSLGNIEPSELGVLAGKISTGSAGLICTTSCPVVPIKGFLKTYSDICHIETDTVILNGFWVKDISNSGTRTALKMVLGKDVTLPDLVKGEVFVSLNGHVFQDIDFITIIKES